MLTLTGIAYRPTWKSMIGQGLKSMHPDVGALWLQTTTLTHGLVNVFNVLCKRQLKRRPRNVMQPPTSFASLKYSACMQLIMVRWCSVLGAEQCRVVL